MNDESRHGVDDLRRISLRVAFAGALVWGAGSCYFLSNFDELGGTTASSSSTTFPSLGSTSTSDPSTTETSVGSGGAGSNAPTAQSSSQASSAVASSTGMGGAKTSGSGGMGGSGCAPPGFDYTGLVMNELAPKGLPDDWIELRNNSAGPIPLCGVIVTQDYDGISVPTGPDRFTFGDVALAAGKYVVIASGAELPFGLSKDAPERITLFSPDEKVLDDTSWIVGASDAFTALESLARIPDGTGPFLRGNNPTKGTSNYLMGGAGGAGGAGGGT